MQTSERLMADFTVKGIPKGEPRVRATVRGGHAHVYSSDVASAWKYATRGALMDNMPGNLEWPIFPPGCPVGLRIVFYMPRPKNHFINGDPSRGLKSSSPTYHTVKCDIDNACKGVMDALGPWPKGSQGLLWDDDKQVVSLEALKVYPALGQSPGARITAFPMPPDPFGGSSHGV